MPACIPDRCDRSIPLPGPPVALPYPPSIVRSIPLPGPWYRCPPLGYPLPYDPPVPCSTLASFSSAAVLIPITATCTTVHPNATPAQPRCSPSTALPPCRGARSCPPQGCLSPTCRGHSHTQGTPLVLLAAATLLLRPAMAQHCSVAHIANRGFLEALASYTESPTQRLTSSIHRIV